MSLWILTIIRYTWHEYW